MEYYVRYYNYLQIKLFVTAVLFKYFFEQANTKNNYNFAKLINRNNITSYDSILLHYNST